MIVDWTKTNNALIQAVAKIMADIDEFTERIWSGEQVIIRIRDGLRLEISSYLDDAEFDIKSITKDFKDIYEFNDLKSRVADAEQRLRESIQDNEEMTRRFNELLELRKKLDGVKCYIDVIETKGGKSKSLKTIADIPVQMIKAYVVGYLAAMMGIPGLSDTALRELLEAWRKKKLDEET